MKFPIYFPQLQSNTQKAITICNNKGLGHLDSGKVVYSPYEAFYLIETKKAELIKNEKPISVAKASKLILKNKQTFNNYLVFKNLRERGYIVKTGLKFGAEFRVFKKTDKHARWLVYITTEKEKADWQVFISKNRIAHSTGKKLLVAIIDTQQDITYYEVTWIKP